ncbi:uncharacterized protein BJ212DRAFT_1401995 [Suillus subaureus]|uniref:Uncharacterized protein n=1 Tax=Suillus subaureus TaxID=48587 RepID=A0A9P7DP72_9AGAM|nr:uncharacterized protein BJ212DRAFT_1401995 [Suillus subaureus]KAG1799554.1 hypothetical protein BJ212DRAFT_1401995 [Suillus subaureus]
MSSHTAVPVLFSYIISTLVFRSMWSYSVLFLRVHQISACTTSPDMTHPPAIRCILLQVEHLSKLICGIKHVAAERSYGA